MKKCLLAIFCLVAGVCSAQSAQPLFQPQQHFVDGSGNPCSGCRLYSFSAGTTTPQPTYTTASGTVQNTNPIILDASGSAAIWMGSSAYKFALLDTYGTTLWTVDNVLAPTPGNQSNAFLPLAGGTMSGNINLGGNSLLNIQNIGVGTSTPAWSIDVESGAINSSGGYLYAGAAPSAHYLCGNGTYYVDCSTFPWGSLSGIPTFYYQTLEDNSGTPFIQRTATAFGPAFTLEDSPSTSPPRTNVNLASIDTAGSCTNCTISYDVYGRVTAASTGTPAGGITQIGTGSGCSFANDGNGLTCTTTVTLPSAFTDTSYSVSCSPQFSSAVATTTSAMPSLGLGWSVASTSTITIYEALNNGSSTGYAISHSYGVTVTCVAHHA